MLLRTAIGNRKIGIIELMMCTVLPVPISNPMVHITVMIARAIGANTTISFRKKTAGAAQ